jgi:hypothetical protein
MSAIQPNYLILNAASGTDVVVSEGSVVFGATTNVSNAIQVSKISNIFSRVYAAGTNQVSRVVVPATITSGATYSFQILLKDTFGEYYPVYVAYQALSGDTTASVVTGLTAALNAYISNGLSLTVSATSPNIDVTGTATNRMFVLEAMENVTASITTAGVETFGTGDSLIAQGITGMGTSQPVSGTTYSLVLVDYSGGVIDANTISRNQEGKLYIYYVSSGTTFLSTGVTDKLTAVTAGANTLNVISVPTKL